MIPLTRRAQCRQPELILALFAELSSATLGSRIDLLRLAAEVISICHPCINLLSEMNLSNWSGISNSNKASSGRGQGPQGKVREEGIFIILTGH